MLPSLMRTLLRYKLLKISFVWEFLFAHQEILERKDFLLNPCVDRKNDTRFIKAKKKKPSANLHSWYLPKRAKMHLSQVKVWWRGSHFGLQTRTRNSSHYDQNGMELTTMITSNGIIINIYKAPLSPHFFMVNFICPKKKFVAV